ncbi:MAG: hypothetical protein ACTSYD_13570 [Candidatus Heimdallarchaeaceae archaeon]
MAEEENKHAGILRKYTKRDVQPYRWQLFWYKITFAVFGITFGMKLLEKGEDKAIEAYSTLLDQYPDIQTIITDEEQHEAYLISLINKERRLYFRMIRVITVTPITGIIFETLPSEVGVELEANSKASLTAAVALTKP